MNYLKNIGVVICLVFAFHSSQAQVGINTIEPKSTLDINGNLSLKTIGVPTAFTGGPSGNATLINDGTYISLTPTSGNLQFYVQSAAATPGRIYILRNISSTQQAQIYSAGGEFYAKNSVAFTVQPLTLPTSGDLKTVILISDGLNWTYFF